jgi:hypothetical protein
MRFQSSYTPPAGSRLDSASSRKRVTPASLDRVVAEFILQRHVNRPGKVAVEVVGAPVRLVETPTHIEDCHRLAGFE